MDGDNDRDGQGQHAEITVAEAAALLGLTEQTITQRIRRGWLPARRVGDRLWLLPRAAVEQAAQVGRLKPGPRPAAAPTSDDDQHSAGGG